MKNIKDFREIIGVNKVTMAAMIGISPQSYTVVENGKYILSPNAEIVFKIKTLKAMYSHIELMKKLEPEILTAIENLKNEIK